MPVPLTSDSSNAQDFSQDQAKSSTQATYGALAEDTLLNSWIGKDYQNVMGNTQVHDLFSKDDSISQQDAKDQYGVNSDGPISKSAAEFAASNAAQQRAIDDTLARGGSQGASNTWLGSGLSMAVGMLDPFQDAAAVLSDGLTKFAPIRPGFISTVGRTAIAARVAGGIQSAATFEGITEPIHAMTDQDWTPQAAMERLGSAALFMGITHGLFGKTPLKQYSEQPEPTAEEAQTYQQLEQGLQPETKAAMAQASAARAKAGSSIDPINAIIGLDPRIIEHEAKLGGVQLSLQERARVLASMDNGTYIDPTAPDKTLALPESKVTLQTAPTVPVEILPPEEKASLQPQIKESKIIDLDQTPTEKPLTQDDLDKHEPGTTIKVGGFQFVKGTDGGWIKQATPAPVNQSVSVQSLMTSRLQDLKNRIQAEQKLRQNPPAIQAPLPLTEPAKQAKLLLQPQEVNEKQRQIEDREQQKLLTNGSSGSLQASNGGSTSSLERGFYGLSHKSGAKGSIRLIKGSPTLITPQGKAPFGDEKSALAAAKEQGFTPTFVENKAVNSEEQKQKQLQAKIEKEKRENEERRLEENKLETDFPTHTIVVSAPEWKSEDIAKAIAVQQDSRRFEAVQKQLKAMGWAVTGEVQYPYAYSYAVRMSDIGVNASGYYSLKAQGGALTKAQPYDNLPQEIKDILSPTISDEKDIADSLNHQFLQSIGEDSSRMLYYAYQLPFHPIDGYLKDFKQIRLALDTPKETAPWKDAGVFWTNKVGEIGHAHIAIVKDISGNDIMVSFEVQGTKSEDLPKDALGNPIKETSEQTKARIEKYNQEHGLPPNWEISRRLLVEAKKEADKQGVPLVVADAETMSRVYRGNNEPVSRILANAYSSKYGYVTEGMKRAFPELIGKPLIPYVGQELWMPFEDFKAPFSGYVTPGDDMLNNETASERIDNTEDKNQAAYEKAIGCVTK